MSSSHNLDSDIIYFCILLLFLKQWFPTSFCPRNLKLPEKKIGETSKKFNFDTTNCQSFKSRGFFVISHGTLIGNHCFKVIRSYKNKIGINDWQCLVQTLKCVYQYSSIQVIRRMRLVSCLSTNKL